MEGAQQLADAFLVDRAIRIPKPQPYPQRTRARARSVVVATQSGDAGSRRRAAQAAANFCARYSCACSFRRMSRCTCGPRPQVRAARADAVTSSLTQRLGRLSGQSGHGPTTDPAGCRATRVRAPRVGRSSTALCSLDAPLDAGGRLRRFRPSRARGICGTAAEQHSSRRRQSTDSAHTEAIGQRRATHPVAACTVRPREGGGPQRRVLRL